jgi:hypothetical protein
VSSRFRDNPVKKTSRGPEFYNFYSTPEILKNNSGLFREILVLAPELEKTFKKLENNRIRCWPQKQK